MTSSSSILVDSEAFIMEVKSRPAIWDIKDEAYNNRVDKHNAWQDVCRVFVKDYDSKTDSEQNLIVNELQKKWKHLRNCFTRELNKQQTTQKRGSGTDWRRKYKFYHLLEFLIPFCSPRSSNTLTIATGNKEPSKRVTVTMVQDNHRSAKRMKPMQQEPQSQEQTVSYKQLSERLNNRSIEEKDDPDRQFLLSLLPDFKAIPQSVKIDAKFEIMSILHKYNRPQGLPQYYSAAETVPQYTTTVPSPQYSLEEQSSNFEVTEVKLERFSGASVSKCEESDDSSLALSD